MKSYTDLEQSKKLAEFLPLKSADLYYDLGESKIPNFIVGSHSDYRCYIPCWSLAALLNVLPTIEGFCPIIDLDINLIRYEGNYRDKLCFSENNLVDACYKMIIKLHELKML